jgi:hypothetical protein
VVPGPFIYPDLDEAITALTASGPMMSAIRHSGREAVVGVLTDFLAPRAEPDGGVRMDVSFRYTLGRRRA